MKYATNTCEACGKEHNGLCKYYCPQCIKDIKRKNVQETKPCYYCRCRKPNKEMRKESNKYICYYCFITYHTNIYR
jgi:hypothetical protein